MHRAQIADLCLDSGLYFAAHREAGVAIFVTAGKALRIDRRAEQESVMEPSLPLARSSAASEHHGQKRFNAGLLVARVLDWAILKLETAV